MSEAIEAMKKEGWSVARADYTKCIGVFHTLTSEEAEGSEFIVFTRPKPNAIVDFDALNEKLDLLRREECRLSDVLACIRRA